MSQWSGLSNTFKTQVKLKGNKPRVGIALTGIGKYYARGKAFTMDGNTYSDELSAAPSLSLSAKMTGGLSTVNKLNIDILNQDLESNHFAEGGAYPDPENTAVKAYLVFDSGTTNIADAIQFFNGIIDGFPEINYKSLKIDCTSIDKITFKKIGDLVTNSDAPSGYKVPEDSLGRVKPIIYGDHRFAVNFTKDNSQLASNYEFNRENNVVEAIPLGGGEFLIADRNVNSINSNGDAIWMYDETLGRLVEVNDFTVTQNTPAVPGCIISIAKPYTLFEEIGGNIDLGDTNNFYDSTGVDFTIDVNVNDFIIIPDGENAGTYRISAIIAADQLTIDSAHLFSAQANETDIIYSIERYPTFNDWRSPKGISSAGSWANTGRLHDLSLINASEATFGAGDSGMKDVTVAFDTFSIEDVLITAVNLYIKGDWDLPDANFKLYIVLPNIFYFSDNTNTTQFHTHNENLHTGFRLVNNYKITYSKSGGANVGTASIYEVIEKITYAKNISTDNMKIFFGGLGREYGAWINGRHTDEGYSEAHIDDDGSGNLIENAAGVIESILRDTLFLANANNNMNAFNVASNDLSTSKLSFSITERTESNKLIHDILERVKSIGYFDYNDKFKMVVYDSSANFTEAGSGTPNDDDKFLFTPTESGNYSDNTRQFDEHPILEDSFWIKKNPANQIVTNFTIEYYKTHDGKFAKILTDTDTTYHAEDISKTFSHPYTKDQTTAQIWLTFLKDRLNRKHWAAGWSSWYNAIGKEMWDVINVQHPVITSLVASYATKKWRILNIDIQTDLGKISVEVEEQ